MNTRGFLRGISAFFFPESLIAAREVFYTSLSVLFFILIIGISLFFIAARPTIIIFVLIVAIITPLLFMPTTYPYATPSDPPYRVMGSICHRIYLGMAGFSIMAGTTTVFLIEMVRKYIRPLSAVIVVLFTGTIFVSSFVYTQERMDIWRKQGKVYKDISERIKSYKPTMSQFSRIYLIGSHLSFLQPMFRLYFNNENLIVEIIDSNAKITDPEAGVLQLVEMP